MARKTDTPALELAAQTWDLRSTFGRNVMQTLESFVANNNYTAIETFTNLAAVIRSHPAAQQHLPLSAEIKFRTVDYVKGKPIKTKADYTSHCKLCGQGLRRVHKMNVGICTHQGVQWLAKPFDIGINHHEDLPALIEAMGDSDYALLLTPKGKSKDRKSCSDSLVEIVTQSLSERTHRLLASLGVDEELFLQAPEAAKYIGAALQGDESGLWYALDPGNSKTLLGWAQAQVKAGIAPKQIETVVAKLEDVPHCVTHEELATLFAYELQERREPMDAVARHLKADLEYLAELSLKTPQHQIVKDYGKVSLRRKFTPLWYYRGVEKPTQASVDDALQRSHLTFADAEGIRREYPKLAERRLTHNRRILEQHCTRQEFNEMWQAVKTLYDADTETWNAMRKKGHDKAETLMLKEDYDAIKAFATVSGKGEAMPLDNAQRLFSMPTFAKVLPAVVMAARKAQVYNAMKAASNEHAEAFLKQRCIHISEVSQHTAKPVNIAALADKLLHSYINHDSAIATESEKKHAKTTGMHLGEVGRVAKNAATLALCSQHGMLPLKYVQPKSPSLTLVQDFLEDYHTISPELQRKLDTLYTLQNSIFPWLKYWDISADTGKQKRRAGLDFSPNNFLDKKYASSAQKAAIEALYSTIKADKVMGQLLTEEGRKELEERTRATVQMLDDLRVWETTQSTALHFPERILPPGDEEHWRTPQGDWPRMLPGMTHPPIREVLEIRHDVERSYKQLTDAELQRCIALLSDPQYESFWNGKIPANLAAFFLDTKQHAEKVRVGPELARQLKNQAEHLEEKLDYRKAMLKNGFDLPRIGDELEQAKGKYYALENGRIVTLTFYPKAGQYMPTIDELIKRLRDPMHEVSNELVKDVTQQLWLLREGTEVPQYVTLLYAPRDVTRYLKKHTTYEVQGDSTARLSFKDVAIAFGPKGLGWQWRNEPKGRFALLTHEKLTEALQNLEKLNNKEGTSGRIRILSVEG